MFQQRISRACLASQTARHTSFVILGDISNCFFCPFSVAQHVLSSSEGPVRAGAQASVSDMAKGTLPGHLIVQGSHRRYLLRRTARGSPVRSALTGPLASCGGSALCARPSLVPSPRQLWWLCCTHHSAVCLTQTTGWGSRWHDSALTLNKTHKLCGPTQSRDTDMPEVGPRHTVPVLPQAFTSNHDNEQRATERGIAGR